MAFKDFSTTPSENSSVSSINFAEGQAAASVNNSARQLMADLKDGAAVQVANVAAMTALTKSKQSDGAIVYCRSYTTDGDGGGGFFRWDASSTTTEDSGSILEADESGTGRWIRILNGLVATPQMFGAVADDNSLDMTAAFNACLAAYDEVHVPSGTYRIDGTVTQGLSNSRVRFAPYARLFRQSAYSAATTPVFHLKGSSAVSEGGYFQTENNHTTGLVVCGHLNEVYAENLYDSLSWKLVRPTVLGIKAAGNIDIWVPCALVNYSSGTTYANYFGSIVDPYVRRADKGIVFGEESNAHELRGGTFWEMGTSAVDYVGAVECRQFGGFLHTSDNGVCGVRLLNGSSINCIYNTVSGFTCEPGGASSTTIRIESGCEGNYVHVHANTSGSDVISNENNTIFINGSARSIQLSDGNNANFLSSGKHVVQKRRTYSKTGTIAEGGSAIAATLTNNTNNTSGLITVKLTGSNASGLEGGFGLGVFHFAIANSVLIVNTVQAISTDTVGVILGACTTSGNDFRINITGYDNSTATNYGYALEVEVFSEDQTDFTFA